MTEDEAKTKLCCGPPVVAITTLLANPDFSPQIGIDPTKCSASACMAWRSKIPGISEGASYSKIVPLGYCGLAGHPQ